MKAYKRIICKNYTPNGVVVVDVVPTVDETIKVVFREELYLKLLVFIFFKYIVFIFKLLHKE